MAQQNQKQQAKVFRSDVEDEEEGQEEEEKEKTRCKLGERGVWGFGGDANHSGGSVASSGPGTARVCMVRAIGIDKRLVLRNATTGRSSRSKEKKQLPAHLGKGCRRLMVEVAEWSNGDAGETVWAGGSGRGELLLCGVVLLLLKGILGPIPEHEPV